MPRDKRVEYVLNCSNGRGFKTALGLELVEDHLPCLHSLAMGLSPRLGICSKANKALEIIRRE